MDRVNIIVGAVIGVVLVVALAVIVGVRTVTPGNIGEPCAVVHDSDGKTYELPLSRNAELRVETSLGTNVVVVEDGAVFVREANCPNHDCMRQGKIDGPGVQIFCLPHEMWIEVVADGRSVGHLDMSLVPNSGSTGSVDAVSR